MPRLNAHRCHKILPEVGKRVVLISADGDGSEACRCLGFQRLGIVAHRVLPSEDPLPGSGRPAGQHLIELWHDGLDRLVQPRPDDPRLWIARDAQPPHGRCIVTRVEAV